MERDQKNLIRAVVRQVHPDLFTAFPEERSRNAESLKALNVYADQVSRGEAPAAAPLEFYLRSAEGAFTRVTASLREDGSLAPLFLAFGLISEEEAAQYAAAARGATIDGRDLFEWLSGVASEAALTAEQHDAMKRTVRLAMVELEERFGIASLDLGDAAGAGGDVHAQHVEALATLRIALEELDKEPGGCSFEGLSVRLYHPDAVPLTTEGFQSQDGAFNVRSVPLTSHVGDSGTVHIVADSWGLANSLRSLDLPRARLLGRVNSFWALRSRALAQVLKNELGVENVWFDSKTEAAEQRFVLWAGTVLDLRDDLAASLAGQSFAFSVLVHSDESSPLLDFVASSSVLQVRTNCPPKHLFAFMASEAGAMAHETAALVADTRAEEEEVLAAVRDALGAKHVVRVCSSYDQEKVIAAAQRLVEAAPSIRASVDLSGVSLAIDDCYEVWDSGFVSIPFDFSLTDIKPQLQALLAAPRSTTPKPAPASSSGAARKSGTSTTVAIAGCILSKPAVRRQYGVVHHPYMTVRRQHKSGLLVAARTRPLFLRF